MDAIAMIFLFFFLFALPSSWEGVALFAASSDP